MYEMLAEILGHRNREKCPFSTQRLNLETSEGPYGVLAQHGSNQNSVRLLTC